MARKPTKRQQFWLEHIEAADRAGGSVAAYARAQGLKPKELYQWKALLRKAGLLPEVGERSAAALPAAPSGFVEVVAEPSFPVSLAVIFPSGARLEVSGNVSDAELNRIIRAVR